MKLAYGFLSLSDFPSITLRMLDLKSAEAEPLTMRTQMKQPILISALIPLWTRDNNASPFPYPLNVSQTNLLMALFLRVSSTSVPILEWNAMNVTKCSARKKNTVESLNDGNSPKRSTFMRIILINFWSSRMKKPATTFILRSYFLYKWVNNLIR